MSTPSRTTTGSASGTKNITKQPISNEDYFRKNSEFRLWLMEHKHRYFDELDKDQQRTYFAKFVRKWNAGSLRSKFYEGIRSTHIPRQDSTRHTWTFSKKLDSMEMDKLRDTVESATYTKQSLDSTIAAATNRRVIGPVRPGGSSFEDEVDQEDQRRQQYLVKKHEMKQYKKHTEMVMEELAPKATGRDAMLEKKRERAAYTKRDRSPDVTLDDKELLGGGDDFKSVLARQRTRELQRNKRRDQFTQEKTNELHDRAKQYQQKEEATIEMFRRMAEAQQYKPAHQP